MKVEPFELFKDESHIQHIDESEIDKFNGFSFWHKKGKEFAIWCKSYSFAKRQHKAATSIKLSDRVGGVSAIFGFMTLTTKASHSILLCG